MAKHHKLRFSDSIGVSDEVSGKKNGVLLKLGPAVAKSGASLELTIDGGAGGRTVEGEAPATSVAPKVEATFPETQWLIATCGFGLMLGGVFHGATGGIVGGVAGYFWGKWRWSQANG